MPGDRARELAYFGDVDQLQSVCGNDMTLAALEKAAGTPADALFSEAVKGEAWPVISLLATYGWPDRYPNVESWSYFVSPQAVSELAKRIPNFKERIGTALMLYASRQGNVDVMRSLKAGGVQLNHLEISLAAAVARRDRTAIAWLMENGAEPSAGGRESPLEIARQLRSADLLALLDTKGKLSAEVSQLRAEYAPSEKVLAGTWAYRKDGFGSLVLVLYPDGTGALAGDVGTFPVLWKTEGNAVNVVDLPRSGAPSQKALTFVSEQNRLVFRQTKGGEVLHLTKELAANEQKADSNPRIRPERLRVKAARLDGDGTLWIQVNGAHASVPISRLVDGAKRSTYGRDANAMNTLDWESFVPGALPEPRTLVNEPIPTDERSADPGYSVHWEELYITHGKPAELRPGAKYTLFRGLSEPVRFEGNGRSDPEYPYAFALLSREPFANGKRWLLFFLRKGRADHSLP